MSDRRGLVRAVTLVPAACIILANIIGTGVFVKARVMICNVGSPGMVLLVWVIAGLLSLAGAIVYAELSTMMPRAGGEFNYIGAAYGRLWAFLFGWTKTLAVGASIAALAIIFVVFLNDLVGDRLSPLMQRVLPVAVIVAGTLLNFSSARANGAVATALTVGKVTLVLGIGVGAFIFGDGSWANFGASCTDGTCEGVPESARLGVTGFGAAMLGALWGYNGWAVIAMLGSEVKDPARTLPRALIGGTLLVIVLYILVNAAYFYILTPSEIGSVSPSSSVAYEVTVRVVGAAAASVMSAGLMLSAYGTLHAGLLTSPRLPYALAKHGLLPRFLSTVSVRGVPVYAVLAMGVWSIILTLSGTFDILTDMYIFVLWIFYGMTGTALFVLRRRHPDAERPYRVWGYPVVPALFLLVTAYLLVNTLIATPGRALAGLLLIVAGLPVYAYFTRRATADVTAWLGEDAESSGESTSGR
ncbi:MAG: amino acid permease [Phycisphaerales bacterium]|nr:amino acid permease [Phycisphaerales bacterium]